MKHLISFYSGPITNKKPSGEVELCQLHKYITENQSLMDATASIRKAYEAGDMNLYKRRKLSILPFVTPSGVFTYAKTDGLVYPSGLFVVDYDNLPSYESAVELRDKLFADAFLQARLAFVSPSGRGVKVFIPYEMVVSTPFEEYFRNLLEHAWFYIQAVYDVAPDRSGKDIARNCLICHDPDARYRAVDEIPELKINK